MVEGLECAVVMLSHISLCQFNQTGVAEHPRFVELQMYVLMAETVVNFVCHNNVEGTVLLIYIDCYLKNCFRITYYESTLWITDLKQQKSFRS